MVEHAWPNGLVVVLKRGCPTCEVVVPVLGQLAAAGPLTVVSQDDPSFPEGLDPLDDSDLRLSEHLRLETVPTLLRFEAGQEVGRTAGWKRSAWEELSGVTGLGPDLPPQRPGCGSRTLDPDVVDLLLVRRLGSSLQSRRLEIGGLEDDLEAMFDRGWTDGLPVVPPTPARVLRMLEGTSRSPDEVVAVVPPDLVPCTVEKVAVNAVLAGCRPAYLPVVLASVEAACTSEFNAHGLLATTYFSGPVVVVDGPVTGEIGMNGGVNALGQGNRANLTIGRALQLVIRNVGGGRPGGVDRATLGNPGKLSFCFAEDEAGSPWPSLAASLGASEGGSAVTLFAGEGVRGVVDQASRTADSLARSLAACLRTVAHPKLPIAFDALVVVCPEHARVFAGDGWTRERLIRELDGLLQLTGGEIVRGAGGMAEGVPPAFEGVDLPKFGPGGLLVAHAGGTAGMFSAIIGGWVNGEMGSQPVTREVDPWR